MRVELVAWKMAVKLLDEHPRKTPRDLERELNISKSTAEIFKQEYLNGKAVYKTKNNNTI